MSNDSFSGKLARTGLAVAGAVGLYIWAIRPWMLRLGTTVEEASRSLPGDDLIQHPKWGFTHAVTIHTEPDEIWPWLVQWGYGRGGFYSYDWLDRLLGATGVKSADRILLDYQNLHAGDTLAVEPKGNGFRVERVEPNKYLLLSNRLNLKTMQPFGLGDPHPVDYIDLTWLWYLDSIGGCRTRLISRARVDMSAAQVPALDIWMGEPLKPGSAIMDWGMLQGIKRRAEEAGCTPNDQ